MIEDVVRPAGPYRLHLMTYGRPFETPLPGGGVGEAWQRSDGHVVLRAPDAERLELLRFVLALDADTTEFGSRFRRDPLLSAANKGDNTGPSILGDILGGNQGTDDFIAAVHRNDHTRVISRVPPVTTMKNPATAQVMTASVVSQPAMSCQAGSVNR